MKRVAVYMDSYWFDAPKRMGWMEFQLTHNGETVSFTFDGEWLNGKWCRVMDAELQLLGGRQYQHDRDKANFGVFMDSAPDRWGRVLMDRRESIIAREACRRPELLQESDYLLGVYDETRMGALRFRIDDEGEFVCADTNMTAPPIAAIRELEYASMQLEADPDILDSRWIKLLLAPGSSLGGARPKANIREIDDSLWIAKFPSKKDKKDVGAWEAVAMTLARKSGIEVSDFAVKQYNSGYHTFVTKRFDRTSDGKRIHFASAMTMLGYNDGDNASVGCSYLELVDWIQQNGCNVDHDLEQLYRRMVFNIAISNCDDHLRNHGFLLTEDGWTLSPAYDLNPDEYGRGLSLNITDSDNSLSLDLAREVAPYFGLEEKSDGIIKQITTQVSGWACVASRYHIPRSEQERMAAAFR